MINGQRIDFLSVICREHCPWIAHICHIAHFSYDYGYYSTGSWLVDYSFRCDIFVVELLLGFLKPLSDGFFRLPRERSLSDDKLMEIVPEKIGAASTSMSIINPEKRTHWPFLRFPRLRFQDIQNEADSVFIVFSHNSLICIRCIGYHNPVLTDAALSGLIIRDDNPWGRLKLHQFFVIFVEIEFLLCLIFSRTRFYGLLDRDSFMLVLVSLERLGLDLFSADIWDVDFKLFSFANEGHIFLFWLGIRFFSLILALFLLILGIFKTLSLRRLLFWWRFRLDSWHRAHYFFFFE